ncbi:hypothetical protein Ssi03_62200 [Sphaerisporangium siamense]|uniref:Uncharacterized protein n=1 Tax=Sphaerisporangium siamense TaxID=795645 RepID=A0A7W7DBG4_9ACTN|nr:hypothetical protein [Sphaerisporangium siamense]MBB4702531.1 hypothetical protein [Sphaerisporangium siamense]GII88230.1 hypothetical protein Ssi03_62200 [Sphaerisporangium siamense]
MTPSADVPANLADALGGLVPLAIAELRGSTFQERRAYLAGAADIIASKADQMMFHNTKRVRAASTPGVLPAIVRGLAVGAYQPGGATILGVHACAHPHPWCPATTTRPACCTCDPAACTATIASGSCPGTTACAWCGNGCPRADTDTPCCAPTHVMGRLVRIRDAA